MNLNVKDRIGISSIVPYNGNMEHQKLVKSILEKAALTEEEKHKVEWRRERNGMVTFSADKNFEKEVSFTTKELALLKDQVKNLDEKGAISQDNLDICEKINTLK